MVVTRFNPIRLLDQTGLQYVVLNDVAFDESRLNTSIEFCAGAAGIESINDFTPSLITPTDDVQLDLEEEFNYSFQVKPQAALEAFRDKWAPLLLDQASHYTT